MNNLSTRHEAFAREYHKNGFNGLQAYKTVYGGTDKACVASSARLMTSTKIKDFLSKLKEKDSKVYQVENAKIQKLKLENKILHLEVENQKLQNEKITLKLKEHVLKKLENDDLDLFLQAELQTLIKVLGDDLYFILNKNTNLIKIGRSKEPEKRLAGIKHTYLNQDLEMVSVKTGLGYLELDCHREFASFNVPVNYGNSISREWFQFNDLIKIKIQSL